EPKTQPCCFFRTALAFAAAEWIEESGAKLRRDPFTFIVYRNDHGARVRFRVDDDWASGVAVNDRIADQVGEHLHQAILIGCDGDYGGWQLDGTLGMRNTKLVDDLRQCVFKIHWLRIEFESTREPITREIEDLCNHAAHAVCA